MTIYTIAYNGYGRFIEEWVNNVKKQSTPPSEIIVVLGKNHGLVERPSGVTYIESESDVMGTLRNLAIRKAKSEWLLYFSADDILLPNAIDEIQKVDADAVALRYIEVNKHRVTKQSALIEDILGWNREPLPGYVAHKRKHNNKILYYEDIEIPNYPFLFLLRAKGIVIKPTENECAIYIRRVGSHGDLSHRSKKYKDYSKYIDERARYYHNYTLRHEKDVKVKVLRTFNDLVERKYRMIGSTYVCKESRANELVKRKIVEIVLT